MDLRENFITPFPKINTPLLILLTLIAQLIISFLALKIAQWYGIQPNANAIKFDSMMEEFIMVVILAPIVGILFCQYFLINLIISLNRFLFEKEFISLAIFLSALLFGLGHDYNYAYLVTTFIKGLVYGIFFLLLNTESRMRFPVRLLYMPCVI